LFGSLSQGLLFPICDKDSPVDERGRVLALSLDFAGLFDLLVRTKAYAGPLGPGVAFILSSRRPEPRDYV